MSVSKGYPTQEKDDRLKAQFPTVETIRELQHGLSVLAHMYCRSVGTDAVEANSTTYVINATAHAAQKGDVIRFTSGAFDGREVKVWEVDTNTITLAETLSAAPAAADTFEILRHKYPVVAADGSLSVSSSPAPIQFVLDGVDTEVEEDTVTPANNRPLPVKLVDLNGNISINVANQNINVQLDHTGANADSVRIGDGTETVNVNASNELQVRDDDANTTLSSLDGKIVTFDLDTGVGNEDVPGVSLRKSGAGGSVELGTAADPIRVDPTGTTTQPISAASLPLPTGAATEATLATRASEATLALVATEATLSAVNGKLNSLGQKAMAASVPVVIASDQSTLPVSAASLPLPTGAATEATLAAIDAGIPAALGQAAMAASMPVVIASDQSSLPVSVTALDVVDFLDTPLLVASSTNIPASASTPLTVVASLAAAVKKVQFLDTTGSFIGLYSDPAGTPVLEAVFGPGSDQTIEVSLAATTVLGLRNMENSAISSGLVAVNFIG